MGSNCRVATTESSKNTFARPEAKHQNVKLGMPEHVLPRRKKTIVRSAAVNRRVFLQHELGRYVCMTVQCKTHIECGTFTLNSSTNVCLEVHCIASAFHQSHSIIQLSPKHPSKSIHRATWIICFTALKQCASTTSFLSWPFNFFYVLTFPHKPMLT